MSWRSGGGGRVEMGREKAKRYITRALAIAVVLVVGLSPLLLIIDFVGYSPVVFSIWLLSAAYYVFVKVKEDREK